MHGIESWVLAEPVQATSAVSRLTEPLECFVLIPKLRVDPGNFIGTNLAKRSLVPGRRRTLMFGNLVQPDHRDLGRCRWREFARAREQLDGMDL